jgi:transcriptional regulator with XRE-family HTH domain
MKKTTTEEDNYLTNIGLRIKEIRKKNNIKQDKLAKALNTSQPQISRLEKGEQEGSILAYKRIAEVLGVAIEDLVRE